MSKDDRLREALAQIAEIANAAANPEETFEEFNGQEFEQSEETYTEDAPGCVVKSVPKRLLVRAAEIATEINPVNRPAIAQSAALGDSLGVMEPLQIAVLTAKYWGPAL